MTYTEYCGCCGDELPDHLIGMLWCEECDAHVLAVGPLCDRTYFGQHGKPCPYQVGA